MKRVRVNRSKARRRHGSGSIMNVGSNAPAPALPSG